MAVMADRKGFFHCCSIADTLSYKLGSDELGMIPELPDEAIIFPDGVVRLILSMPAGTTLDIESEGNCVSVKTRGKNHLANSMSKVRIFLQLRKSILPN